MKSAGEILKLVQDFETSHSALLTRMNNDYDLWQLKKYTLDKWSESITFNEPRAFIDSIMQTLEAARLAITFRREDKNGDKESAMENFTFSILAAADDRLANRLMPSLKATQTFLGSIRGFLAGRTLFYKDGDNFVPDILPYDPLFLSYGLDGKGVSWSAYTTWRDYLSIENEYNRQFKGFFDKRGDLKREIKVTEYWDNDSNIILVENEVANEKDNKHKLRKPPVAIVPVGSTPLIVSNSDRYGFVSNWGESALAGARPLFDIQNKILSIWLNLVTKSDKPGFFVFDDALAGKAVDVPYGKGEAVTLSSQARVQPIEPPEIARSAPELFHIISEAIQRSTFPYLRYGQVRKGLDPSGRAIGQLLEGPETVLNPLLAAMSRFYKSMIRKLIEQYLYLDTEWLATGFDSRGREFHQVIKQEDIEGNYDLDIEFVSIPPDQEAANYAKAQMAKQAGLAPDNFIREKIIKFQDPGEMDRQLLIQDAANAFPSIKVMRMIDALEAEGKTDEANMIRAELRRLGAQGQAPTPEEAMQETPMQGQPPAGAPPETEIAQRIRGAMGGE